jgi:hypothetical protein
MSLGAGHKALIIAEDWTGNADRADFTIGASGRSAPGTSLQAMEADVSRHAVQVGSSRNPMFQLQMDASGGAVEVQNIELRRDGTAKDTDITAVRLTLDADNDGVFARTDPEIASAVTFTDGKAVFAGTPLLKVTPGVRTIVFVSIDVSPSATLYTTFGVRASLIGSSADSVNFVNSRPTGDIVITKSGGRDSITGHVCINEIHYSSSGYIDWIELINPTSSDVTLTDWEIDYRDGSSWTTLVFLSGTISKSNGLKTVSVSGSITDGINLQLTDGTNQVDTASPPSNIGNGNSYARYRDASDNPTTQWYEDSSGGTQGTKNTLIPEFSDIAYPLVGLMAIFMIVRTSNYRKKRKNGEAL